MALTGRDEWDEIPDDELEVYYYLCIIIVVYCHYTKLFVRNRFQETLWERIEGLGEMVPGGLKKVVTGGVGWSVWGAKGAVGLNRIIDCNIVCLYYHFTQFTLARNTVWIVATTSLIMFLPYIVEKERSDLEKTQVSISNIYQKFKSLISHPTSTNPHPFDPSSLPPIISHCLLPYVNHVPLLQILVDLGVDLFEIDRTTRLGKHLLRLDFDRDVKPKARVNYLESKKIASEDIFKIVKRFRYWLNVDVKTMDARLGWIQQQFRLTSDEIRFLIVKEPRIVMFGLGPLQLIRLFR
uniref:Mitochondrial import receptor subunit TOM22 homolog n=1 Tax=Heterorhabditis bacteriophora TaxID=37862 RepID=A0A1I7W6W4_HETBA